MGGTNWLSHLLERETIATSKANNLKTRTTINILVLMQRAKSLIGGPHRWVQPRPSRLGAGPPIVGVAHLGRMGQNPKPTGWPLVTLVSHLNPEI